MLLACSSQNVNRENNAEPVIPLLGSWRLIQIASMDDTNYDPMPDQVFELKFLDNGTVNITADCNMGRAGWQSISRPHLLISQVALTKRLCRPSAVYKRFLIDLDYIRSYVLRGDKLSLATMADGAILEFDRVEDNP